MGQRRKFQGHEGPGQRYLSPLRYPGGKARLANYVKLVLRSNGLTDGHYVEPYAGGASIALALLIGEYVAHVHINDLDPAVYAFWFSVLNEPAEFCRRIVSTQVCITEWHRQRAVQFAQHASLLDLGFSTFFLNRTNRSGIIRSGGVIGGLKQTGDWQLSARFAKKALIARIERIAEYRDRITLYHRDALALLQTLLPKLPQKTVTYLDPPYYGKGGRRLYANTYRHKDHVAIARLLARARPPWIVSYDDVAEVRALYRGHRYRRYALAYVARERYEGAEIMFFSKGLIVPSVLPVSVSQRVVDSGAG